jgi:hypothetical protein
MRLGALPLTEVYTPGAKVVVMVVRMSMSSQKGMSAVLSTVVGKHSLKRDVEVLTNCKLPLEPSVPAL